MLLAEAFHSVSVSLVWIALDLQADTIEKVTAAIVIFIETLALHMLTVQKKHHRCAPPPP